MILIFSMHAAFAKDTVIFYRTDASDDIPDGEISLATDAFYTQIGNIGDYIVIDKRDELFQNSDNIQGIAFYLTLQKDEDSSWNCTLNAISSKRTISITKSYSNYSRIVLDAKSSVENILANINLSSVKSQKDTDSEQQPSVPARNIDSLAGNWTGEDSVDKIIILRGGRGFVIYKTGASMSISVSVEDQTVHIKQNGKSDASFFTEISNRDVALRIAPSAEPIEWFFEIINDTTLSGTKTTLSDDSSQASKVKKITKKVTWTKK